MTDTPTLTPDDAYAVLNRYASAYKKTARATREMVIDQGRIVAEVYAACEVAGVKAARWLRENWQVSDNTTRNWMRMYEHRDRLPEKIAPSTVYFLFSQSIEGDETAQAARDHLFTLMDQGVQITDALVKKIMRDDALTESISMVASYLLERNGKPKDVLNELSALKAEIDEARQSGIGFHPLFTENVKQRAQAQREERDNVVYVALRVVGGRLQPVEPLALVEGSLVQAQLTLGRAA